MSSKKPAAKCAPQFYRNLKFYKTVENFCYDAGTSSDNLRQIVFYNGSISRELAVNLASKSKKYNRGVALAPSDFLFPIDSGKR